MWNKTEQGLYKRFIFTDFHEAWDFIERVGELINRLGYYPRIQNEGNVVEIWLPTTVGMDKVVEQNEQDIAGRIDLLITSLYSRGMDGYDEKNTTKITDIKLYADGGSRGNPGPSASGFVVLDMSGNVLHREGIYLGITTNNQAEYQSLKLGLEYVLHTFGTCNIHVYMDSMLVVNQMKKIFKVRNRDLWPVHDAIQKLLGKFESVSFDQIPRELNRLADAEVNKCLDAQQGE